ncbi:glycosyltransferase family 4 protein [Acaryochloris sp. CCMEE 5410]|uniref:glycosyltransferase family 4 protein n=1 Tax=Acaryochloris sp. CCMEE 5410 TaxID=310037 RepID=UPI0002483B8F|nr:glycosyltransferase family 4 protein [Acaryochloris sp. CCMEE 5410]KAI9132418.1 glycosyltransferase family 4 protein [Acaryochloris sp. CCMEE 5410]
MKVAVIGPKGLPAKQGGIEHHCSEVYPRMVAQGNSVVLFARSSYTNLSWFKRTSYEGVEVVNLPSIWLRGIDAFLSSLIAAISASLGQYNIVHFHALGPSLFCWLPKLNPFQKPPKIVVTCQGLDWQRAKWGTFSSTIIRLGERAAALFADEITVVSRELEAYFWHTYQRKTVYIPNAPATYKNSDPDFKFGKSLGLESGKYFIFLGRLVPEKRPELLIEAFKRIETCGWKLVLVGGVSDTTVYQRELLKRAEDRDDVVFAGELKGEQLAELVRGAGLFTLPSDLEGLPLAMLEAMREGIPILASDILAHRQLLGTDRGIMFQAGNLQSCIDSIDAALRDLEKLSQMAKRAKKHVSENYTWQKITADNLDLYSALLSSDFPLNPEKSEPLDVK